MTTGPLQGVRITDFTWVAAGPYATVLLSLMGAEVIKIENPSQVKTLIASHSLGLNLSKKSITLDLKSPDDIHACKELIKKSHVVIENFRPGVMDRLGLGYEDLKKIKPDVILVSLSGFGQTGRERDYYSYAPIFSAMGGLAQVTGYEDGPPTELRATLDLTSGHMTTVAVLAALHHWRRTGEGQRVDVAAREVVLGLLGEQALEYAMNKRVPGRKGNDDTLMAPHDVYKCKGDEEWVSIAVKTDEEWRGFVKALGSPAWASEAKYADAYGRWVNRRELDEHVSAWTAQHSHLDIMRLLQEHGVAAMPSFNSRDVFADPHLKARGFLQELDVETPKGHANRVFFGLPWHIGGKAATAESPPPVGQHTKEIVEGLLGLPPRKETAPKKP